MSPALHRGWRKGVRAIVQTIAAGGMTALVVAIAGHLDPATEAVVLGANLALITFLHNFLETAGKIPVLLPTPGIVPSIGAVAGKAVGTVETAVDRVGDAVGDVEGVVTDLGGDLLGEVTNLGEIDDGA